MALQRHYAANYGYNQRLEIVKQSHLVTDLGEQISPCWSKVFALREAIQSDEFDFIFLMDTDSFFVDFDRSLYDLQNAGGKREQRIVVTGDQNDLVNTGNILFPVNAFSRSFVDAWWNTRNFSWPKLHTTHQDPLTLRLMDQPAFNYLMSGGNDLATEISKEGRSRFNRLNGYPGNPDRKYKGFHLFFALRSVLQVRIAPFLLDRRMRNKFRFVPIKRLNWYPKGKEFSARRPPGQIAHYPAGDKKYILRDASELRHQIKVSSSETEN